MLLQLYLTGTPENSRPFNFFDTFPSPDLVTMDPTNSRPPGLEDQLRNLILTNADSSGHQSSSQVSPAQNGSSLNNAAQGSKSGKKRLNQAQRRQMSSQLSIAVDTRPQPPVHPSSHTFNHPGPQQQWRAPQQQSYHHQQNHQQNHQQSQRNYQQNHHPQGRGGYQMPNPQRSWNGPQPLPPPPGMAFSDFHDEQNHQRPVASGGRALYKPSPQFGPEEVAHQAALLDGLCYYQFSRAKTDQSELDEKETFRKRIEEIIRQEISQIESEMTHLFSKETVELKCFGSLASGFATKGSDMDLALISPFSSVQPHAKKSPIPRLIEKALLNAGMGARLLTRTRVPIIKLCEHPPPALYRDLLACRKRWEQGLDEDYEDDDHHNADANESRHKGEKHQTSPIRSQPKPHDKTHSTSEVDVQSNEAFEFEVPSPNDKETRKFFLRQGSSQSLESYYTTAKRVLNMTGARDPTLVGVPTQWGILNTICEAFVRGLADSDLRQRLQRYPSLAFKPQDSRPDRHSLMSIYTQIEGEHALQRWETWARQHGIDPHIQMDEGGPTVISAWAGLCSREDYGESPVSYAKSLQMVRDTFNSHPLFQLAALEQCHEETATQYHTRARSILLRLQGHRIDFPHGTDHVLTEQYIAGIRSQDMRDKIQAELSPTSKGSNLNVVARRHKSLQLAQEFERALEKSMYGPEDTEAVEEYITLLKSPFQKVTTRTGGFDFVVPKTSKTANLVAKIKALPDPRLMAPNQPRDKYRDKLEFPKENAGIQCDINFDAHLALQNTLLLRCYSHTDPRVRPMVLFIKQWAKARCINSGYRGTLSSYGYVLMVLHYLVNIVQPFVSPNLQLLAQPIPPGLSQNQVEHTIEFKGFNIQFWRDEEQIKHLASFNQLNHNNKSIGHLLRGFFEYYAQSGPMSCGHGRGFDWGRDVLSLRTQGGLLSKAAKGWTAAKVVEMHHNDNSSPGAKPAQTSNPNPAGAAKSAAGIDGGKSKTKKGEVKQVRMRYLLAIEDPFEIDHNVARTVTHDGIVSIRDEFRRAWRIIKAAGSRPGTGSSGSGAGPEDFLAAKFEPTHKQNCEYADLLQDLHGHVIGEDGHDVEGNN